MHEVLAHRISIVSVHAGAQGFHPDAAPEDIARAAGVIRASAHAALGDLREVVSLLRSPVDHSEYESAAPPAPGTGTGLIGLAERVALANGRLEHAPYP